MKREPKYPHFLCIGAQKSGTTWLYVNLKSHPGICMPLIKEMHYFNDRGSNFRTFRQQGNWQRVFKLFFMANIFRQSLARTCWLFRFLFLPRTDSWYASLFRSCGDRLIGDITPAYSVLSAKEVEHVAAIMPRARIILLLRNPVERSWSHARMDFLSGSWPFNDFKGRSIEDVPLDVFRRHFDNPVSTLRSDYLSTLRHWGSHFPATQIFVGFFEEIEQSPVQFLTRVSAFIGITPDAEHGWPYAGQHINSQLSMKMPAQVERYLSRKYFFELKDLEESSLLTNRAYVKAWRQEAERHLV